MLSLRDLQLRLSDVLMGAAAVDPALLALVREHAGLGPRPRLDIYADMYRARLVDVLREDFPRAAAIVGGDAFETLAGRYLARHPSTQPSVRYVGSRFADFVAGEAALPPFLADLARLEWARVEVFDAPDAEPLRLSDLESLPATDWPTLRLRPIPACLMVECSWPVHAIWAAAEDPAPGRIDSPRPEGSTIRVWREGWSVSHAAMGDLERQIFPLLVRGEPFARLCAAGQGDLAPETAAREVGGLLMRWIEDGLLARLPA